MASLFHLYFYTLVNLINWIFKTCLLDKFLEDICRIYSWKMTNEILLCAVDRAKNNARADKETIRVFKVDGCNECSSQSSDRHEVWPLHHQLQPWRSHVEHGGCWNVTPAIPFPGNNRDHGDELMSYCCIFRAEELVWHHTLCISSKTTGKEVSVTVLL